MTQPKPSIPCSGPITMSRLACAVVAIVIAVLAAEARAQAQHPRHLG